MLQGRDHGRVGSGRRIGDWHCCSELAKPSCLTSPTASLASLTTLLVDPLQVLGMPPRSRSSPVLQSSIQRSEAFTRSEREHFAWHGTAQVAGHGCGGW